MTGATKKTNGKISGQARQASIIHAAAALFAGKGFTGTTTRAIAAKAGISEALLFKHFPTKRALYGAILAEKAPLSPLLAAVEEAARKRDDAQVFTLIASYRIQRTSDPTLLRLLLFSALEGHDLSEMFFRNQHRQFYDYLSGYLRIRMREGAFRAGDPLLLARAFMGMLAHHRLLHEIFRVPLETTPEDCVRAYVELFLSGVRSPERRRTRKSR